MRVALLVTLLLASVGCRRNGTHRPAAPSVVSPSRPDALTQRVVAAINAAFPDLHVVVVDASTLSIGFADGGIGTTQSLDNLRRICNLQPADCGPSIARSVHSLSDILHPHPPDRSALRAVVRDIRMVQMARRVTRGDAASAGDTEPVARPLIADLYVMYVIDLPDSMVTVNTRTMHDLGLDLEGLHQLAMAQSAVAFAEMRYEPVTPGSPLQALHIGDSYESSRFLLPALWNGIRSHVRGELLVSVPMRDTVLFVGSLEPGGVDALRAETQRLEEAGDHPISTTLFRWTPNGWVVLEGGPT